MSGDRQPVGVAVLGSCMSRDCFTQAANPGYDRDWTCLATQHQSSLLSVVTPPVPVSQEDLEGMKERDQWILREDCEKKFLPRLVELRPRVLLVDLWTDVFFGFRRIDDTYVTNNDWTLPQSPFLRRVLAEHDTWAVSLEGDPEGFIERWVPAAHALRTFVDEHLAGTTVVLHRGTATDELVEAAAGVTLTASGTCIPRDVHRLNALWRRLDDLAEEIFADHVVDVGGHRFPSTTAHRWGSGYVHYVDGYYREVLATLGPMVSGAGSSDPRRAVSAVTR